MSRRVTMASAKPWPAAGVVLCFALYLGLLLSACAREEEEGVAAPEDPRAEQMARRLEQLSGAGPAVPEGDPLDRIDLDPAIRNVFTEYEEHRLRENVRKGMGLWKVRAAFDLSDFDKGLSELNSRLKPNGEVISTLPSSQRCSPCSEAGAQWGQASGSKAGPAIAYRPAP